MKYACLPTIIVCLLLVNGCSKREEIPTKCDYTFTNQTARRITFDLYGSKADYNYNSNRLARNEVAPDGELALTLDVGRAYYLDWYSADYSVNNWAVESLNGSSYNPSPLPKLQTAIGGQHVTISEGRTDTAHSVLIGDGYQSVWKGTYPLLAAYRGEHTYLFRKDFTGRHVLVQGGDTVYAEDITYQVWGADGTFRMQISNSNNIVSTIVFNAVAYHTLSRDTLLVATQDDMGTPIYYPLARQ